MMKQFSEQSFPFVRLPYIIFYYVITIDKSDAYAKDQSHRSMSQRTKQILSQFGHFQMFTLVLIHRWLQNDGHNFGDIEEVLIVFQSHPSIFNITQVKKLPIWLQFHSFTMVTPV